MAQLIGRQANRNTDAIITAVELNATTAVKIADANPRRTFFYVSIDGSGNNTSIFIKLQAAGVDNIPGGIWIGSMGQYFKVCWEMPPDNIYTGEISAIMASGTHIVIMTEY